VDQGQASFQTSVTGAQGNLGSLTLAANGGYTYTVADSAVQYLGLGDSKVDSFTVTALDGTSKQVSFTIHGTNDAAVIGDPTVADVTEDVSVNAAGNLTASGTLSISDADQNQAFFQTGVSGAAGNLGSLALAANGSYTYTVADSTVQYLGVNSTKVDSFTVTALDGTSKQISFTIHGTNDAPSAPIDANAADNHVLAHATNGASVGITAFATDPDAGDTITYQWASNPNNLFAIDANTGVVTVADGANLNAGTYTISVRAVDNHNLAGPATSFAIAVGAGLAGTLSGLSNGHGVENTAVVVASLTDGGPDVLSAATYSWQVSKDGVSWYQEGGGIGQSSFTPSAADFGDQLRVAISYNGDALTLGAGTVLDDPTEVIAVSGGNWKQAQTWSTHGVPGANDDVVLSQNLGSKGVEVNDQEFAHSLSIESAGAILKEGGTLIVSGPITVLNGTLQLQGGATLEAGSIFGTISGSGTNTIEGAGGANTWAEIVSSATINTSANGWLAIDSGATLALGAGTHTENVKFLNNFADNGLTTGTLVIASGATFTGEVFNFHGVNGGLSDTIDFAGLQYTTGQMQVSASFSQGTDITTVTVTNNALHQSTSLKLDGSYTASQFALSQDSGTGTLLKDPPLDPGMAAASHDSFDFAFDSNTALGSSSGPLAANTVIGQLDAISASGHGSAFWLATGSSPELTLSSSGTLSAGKDGAASGTYAVDVVAQDQSTGTSSATQANVWIGGKDAANTPAALASDSNKLIALALDGNHSLQGGSGNDVLIAGSGNDTFVFQANFGHDTISNFKVDTDVIAIDHSVFADFQALLVAAHDDGHGNTVIAPDASNSITVKNVTVAQLAQHQGDFHFM
jgi:VCBS repeat-containing protein